MNVLYIEEQLQTLKARLSNMLDGEKTVVLGDLIMVDY